ncbi:hypothetical protein G3480_25940 [Thiorhodococcus mannitoliphagus]|uniref:Uncharacterized protein n=1 Tax=Thiorhodococcus mannitoliphagus TaxID=329406 RepID=A0A6P1E3C3_9GAMM|nr:hypothetical protein [Thiorhodococcus mannitoliphagus]NEX23673.1 hypothetical protein [Thiorhodococcus mannitoliphagus]
MRSDGCKDGDGARKEGVDTGIEVVKLTQLNARTTGPLKESRDSARLIASRFLGVPGLSEGDKEGGQVVIKIGLTETPRGKVLLGHRVSPLIWRCCQT